MEAIQDVSIIFQLQFHDRHRVECFSLEMVQMQRQGLCIRHQVSKPLPCVFKKYIAQKCKTCTRHQCKHRGWGGEGTTWRWWKRRPSVECFFGWPERKPPYLEGAGGFCSFPGSPCERHKQNSMVIGWIVCEPENLEWDIVMWETCGGSICATQFQHLNNSIQSICFLFNFASVFQRYTTRSPHCCNPHKTRPGYTHIHHPNTHTCTHIHT